MTHVVNNDSYFAPRRCIVCAFLLLIAHDPLQAAEPASTAVAQPPEAHVRALTDLLAAEKQVIKERSEQIQQLFKKIADDLKELEPQGGAPPTPEEARKREKLV